jgi:hypothetical protein
MAVFLILHKKKIVTKEREAEITENAVLFLTTQ